MSGFPKFDIGIYFIFFVMVLVSGCSWGKKEKMSPDDYFTDSDVIALCKAAQRDDIKEIDRLVAKGVDINTKGKENYTPLHYALHKGGKETMRAMLKHGADPNVTVTKTGQCITTIAASVEDDSDWLEMVLEHGGDPNVTIPVDIISPNKTPLFRAVKANNIKNIQLLVGAGANLNHQDAMRYTPAMYAAMHLKYRAVYELLQSGADWKIKDENGLDLAYTCYSSSQDLNKDFPEGFKYNRKALEFLKNKGVDLEAAKKKALKRNGKVYDVMKMECIYYETKTDPFGNTVKNRLYIPEGWKSVVLKQPTTP